MRVYIKILLLFIIALLIYLIFPHKSDKLIYIPKQNSKYYKTTLQTQNTPLNSFDILILKLLKPKEGWVRVSDNTNRLKLFKEILNNKREKTRTMVMYGGDTIEHFSKIIAKQANLDINKLLKIYHKLSPFKEGGIIAKRYKIPYNATEYSVISYMVNKSNNFFKEAAKRYKVDFLSKEFKDKLIIASIIEKETQDYSEMPLISAVIQNRLKKGIRLQMDATLNHGKQSHTIITPQIIKSDNSKYNTYKFKGLPPEPLGSVSKIALISAFLPKKVDYLYFVKQPNGKHIFSKVYKKHLKSVKVYKDNLKKLRAKKIAKIVKRNINIDIPNPNLEPNVLLEKLRYNFAH